MAGRLGVLGGAFNPPHVGHLLLAQEARWQLEIDRVLGPAGAIERPEPADRDERAIWASDRDRHAPSVPPDTRRRPTAPSRATGRSLEAPWVR